MHSEQVTTKVDQFSLEEVRTMLKEGNMRVVSAECGYSSQQGVMQRLWEMDGNSHIRADEFISRFCEDVTSYRRPA